jgi:hypothetical protein
LFTRASFLWHCSSMANFGATFFLRASCESSFPKQGLGYIFGRLFHKLFRSPWAWYETETQVGWAGGRCGPFVIVPRSGGRGEGPARAAVSLRKTLSAARTWRSLSPSVTRLRQNFAVGEKVGTILSKYIRTKLRYPLAKLTSFS